MWGKLISFVVFITVVLSVSAFGLETTTDLEATEGFNQSDRLEVSQSLQEFVDSALIYVKENGKERALEKFNNESGLFVLGDQYAIAFEFDGTCLAHPFTPELLGENCIDSRDVNGMLLNRNMNNIASRGGGFTYYVRPSTLHNNTPELKLSYIAKVDNDWWLASGAWLPDVPAVFSAESRLALVTFVDKAVTYAQENGKEKALEAFNDVNGDFVDGDYYIYALDFNGIVLAHPVQPDKVGKNRSEEPDLYGALYVLDLMDVAKEGTGLLYYIFPEPEKNMTPTLKLSYVRKVDDDWWLGSGIYANEVDQTEGVSTLPYEPPATKDELVSFVESAASYAQVYGKEIATRDFMDLDGPFVRGDIYIFAADFNGTSLALPFLPSAVGTNRLDLQNSQGVYINREMRSIALNGSGFFDYVWTNPITNKTEPKTSYVTKVDDDWWLGAGFYFSDEKANAT